MRVSLIDLENVARCMEEVMPNVRVDIDFQTIDHSSSGRRSCVNLSIENVDDISTIFSQDYDDVFQAYPVLLGIYYGACLAKGKPFDLSPTPSGSDWE